MRIKYLISITLVISTNFAQCNDEFLIPKEVDTMDKRLYRIGNDDYIAYVTRLSKSDFSVPEDQLTMKQLFEKSERICKDVGGKLFSAQQFNDGLCDDLSKKPIDRLHIYSKLPLVVLANDGSSSRITYTYLSNYYDKVEDIRHDKCKVNCASESGTLQQVTSTIKKSEYEENTLNVKLVACLMMKNMFDSKLTGVSIELKNTNNQKCTEESQLVCKATFTPQTGNATNVRLSIFFGGSDPIQQNVTTVDSNYSVSCSNCIRLGSREYSCNAKIVSGTVTGQNVVLKDEAIAEKIFHCFPELELERNANELELLSVLRARANKLGTLEKSVSKIATILTNLTKQNQNATWMFSRHAAEIGDGENKIKSVKRKLNLNTLISSSALGIICLLIVIAALVALGYYFRKNYTTAPPTQHLAQSQSQHVKQATTLTHLAQSQSQHVKQATTLTEPYDQLNTLTRTRPTEVPGPAVLSQLYRQSPNPGPKSKRVSTKKSFVTLKSTT